MSECEHKYQTLNTISHRAHQEGSKKFKSGFEEAAANGIKILVARQQQCAECGKKRTTIEISKNQFDNILALLERDPEPDVEDDLSKTEIKVRKYLIRVLEGKEDTRHEGLAMYKEVWNHIYPTRPFGRGNTNEVVDWIVNISNFDTSGKGGGIKPPLNSIVVRGDTKEPGVSWELWRVNTSAYKNKTLEEAQQECRDYWR
ncbi:MAG: hypothetical protein Q7U16_03820 [Agitococcus sp.]|nr:hypothetical protein [Agitococcus sp.]